MSEEHLVAAILRRDFDAAIYEIEMLKWTSDRWSDAVMKGRKLAFPPTPLPPLAEPLILPAPGQPLGMSLAGSMMPDHYYTKGN